MAQHPVVFKLVGFVVFVSVALVMDAGLVRLGTSAVQSRVGTDMAAMIPEEALSHVPTPFLRGAQAVRRLVTTEEEEEGGVFSQLGTNVGRVVFHGLWSIIYFFLVVSKYPKLTSPNDQSKELQAENEISATFKTSVSNCLLAWICTPARAAHTMDATDTLQFWPAACLMIFCPFCTLWYTNSFTDMNEKLGGTKKDCFMGCLCTFFCSCCVVAQDAESLDLATGATTGCCGVTGGPMAVQN